MGQHGSLKRVTARTEAKISAHCPDFVVELKSASDTLRDLSEKMAQYIQNGATLGWLIDPDQRRVFVYRPQAPAIELNEVAELAADPEMPGFVLNLTSIWNPPL